jgi:WD40 repeat protein
VGTPARWFIGAATTTYLLETGLEDRPELAGEVERMAGLFESLGYTRVPEFGVNLRKEDFTHRLRRFLTDQANRCDDDVVVVYYTGHGVLDEDRRLLLPMADTTADITYSLEAEELTGRLLRSGGGVRVVVQRMLLLLDTCYSGAAGAALAGGAIEFLNRLRGLTKSPSIAIVVAARPNEQASSCAFSQAFVKAVEHRASGGSEPEFLPLDGLIHVVNENTPQWQHARLFLTGDSITPFVPNPRHNPRLHDLDLWAQALRRLREARATDQRDHMLPRARGLDSADSATADLWLFTGRHAALAEACRWLRSPDGPATLVVTGDPGSGKSALLARLAVLADRKLRGRIPRLYTLPAATLPDPGSITRFIHARGLTGDELMAGLCEACGVPQTTSPGRLLAALAGRADPIVIIVDAVDEAGLRTGPADGRQAGDGQDQVVSLVLAPLIQAAGPSPLRLILGTRRHLVPALGEPAEVLDLDQDLYADPASVRRYVESCLVELSEESAYRHQPRAYLQAVAEAVAGAAGSSFLVALITARSLALTPRLADPGDQAWRRGLPTLAADAMRADLDQRLGAEADRARELLLPLAYARGSGLPWEDLWPSLARALSGRRYTNEDLDWLTDSVGYYITESTSQDGRSTYRLYHEALAEYLRAGREDPVADETAIVDTLTDHTPRLADGQTDWSDAHPYVTESLASHAAGTPRLDALAADPRFLLAADATQLLAALPATTTGPARAAADAFRRAAGRLRNSPDHDRPAYLQLAARCARAPGLADAITAGGLPLSYVTEWASWRLQPTHMTLRGHTGSVNAVAVGQVDGRTVIVSGGGDRTVRRWDAATGTALGDPGTGLPTGVAAVAFGQVDGRPVIVSGGSDPRVRMWDAATGLPVGDPLTGHTGGVHAVAVGRVDGQPVIVSGSSDQTVRIWDAAARIPLGQPLTGHLGTVLAVAFGQVDGRPVIISGGHDRTVRIWDPAAGTLVGDPLAGHAGQVQTVASGQIGDRPVIISGGSDRTVRIWDAATGTPVGDPLTGHTGSVNAVAVGQVEGRTVIVSGGSDRTVRIWDAATGTPVGDPLTGHASSVRAVAAGHVDGRPVIISGGGDETVRIWDAGEGALVSDPFTGHAGRVQTVAFGRVDERPVIISGSSDQTVRIWDAATGTPLGRPLAGHGGWVRAVASGQVDGRPVIISGSSDQTVRIWDAATGAPLGRPLGGHAGSVNSVAFGQVDGRPVIISGGEDGTVRIWDAATGTPLGRPLSTLTRVHAVASGPVNGRPTIISGGSDGTVRIWDAATGTPVGDPLTGHAGPVTAVTFGEADGRSLIISGGSDGTVRIWDAATGTPVGDPLTGHTGFVSAVAFGHLDGRPVIISGGSDETVRIWDAATGAPVGDPFTGSAGSVSAVAFGQVDGRPVIVCGGGHPTVRAWDAITGAPIGSPFAGHTDEVRAVAVGQVDGRPVAISGSSDQTVRIWDAATGTPMGDPLTDHAGAVPVVAFGQVKDRPVIISGSSDRTVRIWDAATGTPLGQPLTGYAGWGHAVAFGQVEDRPVIISGSSDRTVRIWDAATGTPVGDPLAGHTGSVTAVAFGQVKDRPVIISGSYDQTVRIWDAATGAPLGGPLTGHTGFVNAVALGQLDGRPVIISGSDDGTVRIWDAGTGAAIGDRLAGHTGYVSAVAFGQANGRPVIISGSDDGTVRIWDAATGSAAVPGPPGRIDLAAPVSGLASAGPGRLLIATELGLVCLRWPG